MKSYKLITALLLLPFFLLCLFVWPGSDDFAMSTLIVDNGGIGNTFTGLYTTWGGRFTTLTIALLNPTVVGTLWLYRLMIFLTLVALFAALWWLWHSAITGSGPWTSLWAGVMLLLWLHTSPDIAEGFYWYSGVVVYLWPLVLLMMAAGWMIRRQGMWWLWSGIALFIACGFNEMAAAAALAMGAANIPVHRETLLRRLAPLVGALVGVAILLSAPGNLNRMQLFGNAWNFSDAVVISVVSLAKLNGIHLMNLSLWLLALLLYSYLRADTFHPSMHGVLRWSPWKVFVAGQSLMLALLFIPAISMGINPPLRVYTFMTPFWILWVMWMAVSLIEDRRSKIKDKSEEASGRVGASSLPRPLASSIMVGLVVLSLVTSFVKVPGGEVVYGGNVPRAWHDLLVRAVPYNRAMHEREALVDKSRERGEKHVVVPALEDVPRTIHFLDITPDGDHWINWLYARVKGVEKVSTKGD